MRRYEALCEIVSVLTDELVVCNLGHPAQELFALRDRPQNFYMLGSMGLATSIGHGLALSQKRKVVVIDGDASVTMNMGGLATIGYTLPNNLVQIVIDNGANGSTGFQPSFTSSRLKLDAVARASGIEHVRVVTAQPEVAPAVSAALATEDGPWVILIRTQTGMPDGIAVIPLTSLEIKVRFMRSLRGEQ
jgi:sulfopyruvate decarboxylase subunit beta